MKSLQRALAPLLITGSFCSLNLLEYPLGQPRRYLTCLYCLTTWSIFVYLYYYVLCNSIFAVMLQSPFNTIIMITAIVSILVSLFRFKELKMCLHKLSIVDDTLETLGTSKKYQRLHKWIIRITSGWIALSLSLNVFVCFWNFMSFEKYNIADILLVFLANHLLHVNTLSALTWGSILRYVSSKFYQVNQHIHVLYDNLSEDDTDCTKRQNKFILTQRKIELQECKRYMWIIMHVHLQLCLISRKLNKVFSVQMIVQMASYFMFNIEICRGIYTSYLDKTHSTPFGYIVDIMIYFIWGMIYNIITLTLNYICQTVYYKANETIVILYKYSNNNLDENLREQVLQFILQIKQMEIKFGLGLYFGYDFIRKFYKSILTYLVIIIQMRSVNTYPDIT